MKKKKSGKEKRKRLTLSLTPSAFRMQIFDGRKKGEKKGRGRGKATPPLPL